MKKRKNEKEANVISVIPLAVSVRSEEINYHGSLIFYCPTVAGVRREPTSAAENKQRERIDKRNEAKQ